MVTPREFDIKLGGHQSALVHDESRSFAAYIKETELIRRVWWTNYHSLHISNVDVTTGHRDCWNESQISGAMRNLGLLIYIGLCSSGFARSPGMCQSLTALQFNRPTPVMRRIA